MMKRRILPILLLSAILLAACAPATGTALPGTTADSPLPPSALPLESTASVPTEAVVPSPVPAATSRGPDLHATDPGTVSLASGGLQLVEFFRFT